MQMAKRRLGNTGLQLTALGFGGAEVGFENAEQATVNTLLNSALDAGLNIIDTAECYNNSESLIGNAVAGRRREFYLFSKCGHDGVSFGSVDWDPKMLAATIDRSLRRLQTDHLDLLLLHSCKKELLERGEVIAVLENAKRAGKTNFIGYSGDGAAALFAVSSGRFDALQTSVNICDQEALELTIAAAAKRGMGVIAKRPVANAVWRYGDKRPPNEYVHSYWQRYHALAYDFAKTGDPAEIALRFTLSIPGVTTAIVGTKNPTRWLANARLAAKGPLPSEMYEKIRQHWIKTARPDWLGEN